MEPMTSPTIAPVSYAAADAAVRDVLTALAGPAAVAKPDQLEAVRAVVSDRRRTLVVQATGWGKSLVYQAAALASRRAGGGPALVVSPLLALMRDQVDAATRAGLTAVTLNSANIEEWQEIEARLLADDVDLLLVSPERLANPRFEATTLQVLLPRLGLLVVDEAHCISDWGFDFRPDYQRLTRVMTARPDLPVLATTATANARVTDDVAAQLGDDTVVLRGPLARASLSLAVVPGLGPLQRYAWVAQALPQLPGSGIVYTLTVAEAERLAGFLSSTGLEVEAYTGRMETGDRERVEGRLRRNEIKAVVATSALGMGYDKPDLGFVIHVGSPASPVAYYQQVGRAGRALDHAVAILLPAESDEAVWDYFATANTPTEATADGRPRGARLGRRCAVRPRARAGDRAAPHPPRGAAQGARRRRCHRPHRCRLGGDRANPGRSTDPSTPGSSPRAGPRPTSCVPTPTAPAASWASCVRRWTTSPSTARRRAAAAARCARAALPGGLAAGGRAPTSSRPPGSTAAARTSSSTLVRCGRRGSPDRRGRIGLDLMAAPGRALAFADDPGWSDVLEPLVGEGAGDGPVGDDVMDGVVALLGRWAKVWGDRPVAVVPVPSRSRPTLVSDLAARIGAGRSAPGGRRAPHLRSVARRTGWPRRRRVEAVAARLSLDPGVTVPAGPVLLVDDYAGVGLDPHGRRRTAARGRVRDRSSRWSCTAGPADPSARPGQSERAHLAVGFVQVLVQLTQQVPGPRVAGRLPRIEHRLLHDGPTEDELDVQPWVRLLGEGAQLGGHVVVAEVRPHTEPGEPDDPAPLLGDVRSRVQGDRLPHPALVRGVETLRRQPVRGRVTALHLEPQRSVAGVDRSDVVEQAGVQEDGGAGAYVSRGGLAPRDLGGVEVGPDAVVRDRLVLDGPNVLHDGGRAAGAVLLGRPENQLVVTHPGILAQSSVAPASTSGATMMSGCPPPTP